MASNSNNSKTRLPIQEPAWWKEIFCYQIYPSSFKDSNGDGVGDLKGITAKVDYLKDLGVDMIWLCPLYKSPMVDMGYDISDYREIHAPFGTMQDWEELVAALKARGMKLIHDLVVNHTSDQHQWFQESKSSKDSPYRDYYIWRPGKTDTSGRRIPPNNWRSIWGNGSAWEYDETTDEYYLHLFSPQQPDLNFTSPALMEEIKDMMRFWLNKGISGFRLDAINFVSKPMDFPDAPIQDPSSEYQPAFSLFNHGPKIHEILQELQRDVLSKYDAFTVGEAAFTSPEQAVSYVRQDREDKEMQMIFHTEHVDLYGGFEEGPQEARDYVKLANVISKWQTYMLNHDSWQSVFLSNHDQPRPINNILQAKISQREEAAKLLCLFLCTQAGTLYCYQGEEVGMVNVPEDWPLEEYKDLVSQDYFRERQKELQAKTGEAHPDMTEVRKAINRKARDNARTPMPWDSSPKAGFTTGTPWMRVNEDNQVCNVADQQGKKDSILTFWKETVQLRKSTPTLIYGQFELNLDERYPTIISYTRELDDKRYLFIANFGGEAVAVNASTYGATPESTLVHHTLGSNEPGEGELVAYEARLYRL
ncbi:glycoside hydrolase family 13 protein [Cystobasidium minutum MCA 4210]|uniref:glycoside hydrolase family 13 protein n=1 Tax=Cystobasidium minutum MCA 4210 TaxID=1397322 RepID=UPI0034D01E44|eukprot:jgi/Rhomi1/20881/CE20880_1973